MRRIALVLIALLACKKTKAPEVNGSSDEPAPAAAQTSIKAGVRASLGGGKGGTFVPSKQGFKFQNYGNEEGYENLTATEVKRMFGADACAEEAEGGACELTPSAAQWMAETNKGMGGGHCEGMASLALLFDL